MGSSEYGLILPIPPSVNALYGGGSKQKRFKSKAYKEWEAKCPKDIPRLNLSGVQIEYTFFFKDNRARDCQNYIKAATDFLVNSKIIRDDCWQHVSKEVLWCGGIDKINPRIEIIISTA